MMDAEKKAEEEEGEYKMEVQLLDFDKKKGKLNFLIRKTNNVFANFLRRSMISEVPTMAIEDVEISKNSSILYDEIIAHRLGLIPLSTDLESYNLPTECKCEGKGCARCQVVLSLIAKGPAIVKAGELKTKDSKIKPVYPEMPIVKLIKGQEIEFIAKACLGLGKEHSKWIPGNVWYTYKSDVKINNSSKKLEEFKDKYPPQIFDKQGKIDKNKIIDPNIIDACDGVCEDILKIEYDETSFVFYVESWGQLTPKDIVITALDKMDSQLTDLTKVVKTAF
jgi:DNA-directed RNA polymerase subunit D